MKKNRDEDFKRVFQKDFQQLKEPFDPLKDIIL